MLFCCGRSPGVKIPKEGESRNDIISALASAREKGGGRRVGRGGERERRRRRGRSRETERQRDRESVGESGWVGGRERETERQRII